MYGKAYSRGFRNPLKLGTKPASTTMAKLSLDLLVGAASIVRRTNPWQPFRKLRTLGKEFDFNVFGTNVRNHLGFKFRDCSLDKPFLRP
jgi:hypothetical protein